MTSLLLALPIGLAGGLAASALMEAYQSRTARLFGQDASPDDSATVQLAERQVAAFRRRPIPHYRRSLAGRVEHYLTGLVLGVGYVLAALHWAPIIWGFGVAFGIATMILLDELAVPALRLGPWPWATPLRTHLYSLTSHIVFGAVLEGVRRLSVSLLG